MSSVRSYIYFGDNMQLLQQLDFNSIDLIYIDPPFNTGVVQKRKCCHGSSVLSYKDSYNNYLAFLTPRLEEARRVLNDTGSFFIHLDYREVHYVKVALDNIFGRDNFKNEIIWAFDYGGRSKKKWPSKHNTILWYTKNRKVYTFNYSEMDRIPYMAPSLAGKAKAAKGKTPTDVWWHTIVSPTGKEKVGYPTQKPIGILKRIIKVHSNPGDVVLDFFAGSGTTGIVAKMLGRKYILCDDNPDAIKTMLRRFYEFTK